VFWSNFIIDSENGGAGRGGPSRKGFSRLAGGFKVDTPGITGLSESRVHIDAPVWHLDVGSSHPGGVEAPKG
jgi:hypothetical protein